MDSLKTFFSLVKATYDEWKEDGGPRLAASLAYYTAFSLAPILIIVIAFTSFVVGEEVARSDVINQVSVTVGPDAAELVEELIDNAQSTDEGVIATVLSVIALLLGAIGVFENLQAALDIMWDVNEVERKSEGVIGLVKNKILSFGMLLVVGFLLLVSLVISTVLAGVEARLLDIIPVTKILLQILSFVLSLAFITLLFAMIFKFLPHARIQWRDVWIGAAVTALLFTLGKFLISLYLGNTSTASSYGAAGAFVLVLLWVYYSAQIVLFGAEFTQVYARQYGSKIVVEDAVSPEANDAERPKVEQEPNPEGIHSINV